MAETQVVIRCMNPIDQVERTIETLGRQAAEFDVTLATTSERRETVSAHAEEHLDGWSVIERPAEAGLTDVLNGAAEPDAYSRILFMDDDVVLADRGMIGALAATVDREGIGAAGPVSLNHDGGDIRCAGCAIRTFGNTDLHAGEDPDGLTGVVDVDALSGVALMVDADAFAATDGWPGEFHIYHNDFELSRRIRAAGYRVVCNRDTTIRHRGGGTPDRRDLYERTYYGVRNYFHFRKRLFSTPRFLASSLLAALFYFPHGMVDAVAKGYPRLPRYVLLGMLHAAAGRTGRTELGLAPYPSN